MSKTVNLDLPHDYWKRDDLRPQGVSRLKDNPYALLVSFNRAPTDDELRSIHDYLRAAVDTLKDAAA
jgi:hypothetical protein